MICIRTSSTSTASCRGWYFLKLEWLMLVFETKSNSRITFSKMAQRRYQTKREVDYWFFSFSNRRLLQVSWVSSYCIVLSFESSCRASKRRNRIVKKGGKECDKQQTTQGKCDAKKPNLVRKKSTKIECSTRVYMARKRKKTWLLDVRTQRQHGSRKLNLVTRS